MPMNNDRIAEIEGKRLALHWLKNALSTMDITLEYMDHAYFHMPVGPDEERLDQIDNAAVQLRVSIDEFMKELEQKGKQQ